MRCFRAAGGTLSWLGCSFCWAPCVWCTILSSFQEPSWPVLPSSWLWDGINCLKQFISSSQVCLECRCVEVKRWNLDVGNLFFLMLNLVSPCICAGGGWLGRTGRPLCAYFKAWVQNSQCLKMSWPTARYTQCPVAVTHKNTPIVAFGDAARALLSAVSAHPACPESQGCAGTGTLTAGIWGWFASLSQQMHTNNKSSQRNWDHFQTAQRGKAASFVTSEPFAQTLKDFFRSSLT